AAAAAAASTANPNPIAVDRESTTRASNGIAFAAMTADSHVPDSVRDNVTVTIAVAPAAIASSYAAANRSGTGRDVVTRRCAVSASATSSGPISRFSSPT